MLKNKLIFYLISALIIIISLSIFHFRQALIIISAIFIITSVIIAVIKVGPPPIKEIYKDYKKGIEDYIKIIKQIFKKKNKKDKDEDEDN